mmetsp:Transcript_9060/g.17721  ORF Transcript_9060/g.17721 Transcript_9060/m.17721 type:complete len:150 (-) Transcript_9060:98-547(-)
MASSSAAAGSSSSSSTKPVDAKAHYSGLWIGEAQPAPGQEGDVPVNPIKWALSICPGPYPSIFGAGFFDDAADVPNAPVLFYVLKGEYDPADRSVKITKTYENRNIPEALKVEYAGKLQEGADGQPAMTGTWTNAAEGTSGFFACRLEE